MSAATRLLSAIHAIPGCELRPGALSYVDADLQHDRGHRQVADDRRAAAAYVDPRLCSLDAIHLATADQLVASGKNVSAFVTYDRRLAEAARACSLSVVAPGADGR